MSLWFAPNSVVDQLEPIFHLDPHNLTQLSISVTIGFVTGGLISTFTNISDIIEARKVFFISTLFGGLSTFLITLANSFTIILILRFCTGFFIAGIYPVGMKLTSSHYKHQRGLAIGILLSALTIGSGLPYLFLLVGIPDWRTVLLLVAILDVIGGLLVFLLVEKGPFLGPSPKFSLQAVKTIFSKKSVRLANYGYYGHMWELFAFWVWFPRFLKLSYETSQNTNSITFYALGSFLVFFFGALANTFGGYLSDKFGRTTFNIAMLSISGLSGLIVGFFYKNYILVLIIGIIWGTTIVPDSPQYSAMITEVADQNLIGSALAIQTAIGFSITIISITLIPIINELVGWTYTFAFLSIGPFLGIISLFLLRREPDAHLIANGLM